MKLVLVGQVGCRPCVALKNQIMDRIDELKTIGCEFEYINLNDLDDKDTFIQKFKLSSTPTLWIEADGFMTEQTTGYIDVDTLFEQIYDYKECK